jgi:FkbM family methyltransferase
MPAREAKLIFNYGDQVYEMAFPFLVHAGAIARHMEPMCLDYVRFMGDEYGPIRYVLDVGASTGTWTLPFHFCFPEAEILAVEPSKYNYPYLVKNTQNIHNIKTIKKAASDIVGRCPIAAPTVLQRGREDTEYNTGLISVYGMSDTFRENVETDLLDNMVTRKVDWLKMDVEGYELAVLKGADVILGQHRPIIQMEVKSANQGMGKSTAYKLLHHVTKAGYMTVGGLEADWILVPKERAK